MYSKAGAMHPNPAPLPIFNKSKRPRQALLAHPNNDGGLANEGHQWNSSNEYPSRNTYSAGYSYQQENHLPRPGPSSGPYKSGQKPACKPQVRDQKGRFAPYDGQHKQTYNDRYKQQQLNFGSKVHTPSNTSSTKSCYTQSTIQFKDTESKVSQSAEVHNGNCANRSFRTGGRAGHSYTPTPQSFPTNSASTAVGCAQEPIQSQKATGEHSVNVSMTGSTPHCNDKQTKPGQRQGSTLRVLTATAQGVQHWSRYKTHTQFMFEVYGIMSSAVSDASSFGKQFTIATCDGVLQCVYWEMERILPPHIRTPGMQLRVVGEWDSNKSYLKCYSVREVHPGEAREELVRQFVEAADRHMRKMVEHRTR